MSYPVVRRTDVCSGHGCYPPRPSATWSPDVFVNNLNIERYSDSMEVHCCLSDCHDGSHKGIHNAYANSLDIQVVGDPIDCGSVCAVGSPDTFAY